MDLDLNVTIGHVSENNRYIKKSSDYPLCLLQCLLIVICFLDTIFLPMILKETSKFFFLYQTYFLLYVCVNVVNFLSKINQMFIIH